MKDRFSDNAIQYRLFRPSYPVRLIDELVSLCPGRRLAWDCGTGSGQVAMQLLKYFDEVVATDISLAQLQGIPEIDGLEKIQIAAEEKIFKRGEVDLITAAQAVHWFEFDQFHYNVQEALSKEGVLALIGYGLIEINPVIDEVIRYFYEVILKDCWDPERKYIDENYRTIPFPFKEIDRPKMHMTYKWTRDQLTGYLSSWSAVHNYVRQNATSPMEELKPLLDEAWGLSDHEEITFPILQRVGRKA